MDSNKFSKIQKFFCFSFVFVRDFLCFVCLFGFLFCFVLFFWGRGVWGGGILHHFDVQNFILMRVYFREILQQINFSDSVG